METATGKIREQVQDCPPLLLRENTTPFWPLSETDWGGGGGAGGGSSSGSDSPSRRKKLFLFKIFSRKLGGSGWRISFLDLISVLLCVFFADVFSHKWWNSWCKEDNVNFGMRNAFISIKVNFVKKNEGNQYQSSQIDIPYFQLCHSDGAAQPSIKTVSSHHNTSHINPTVSSQPLQKSPIGGGIKGSA